MPLARLVCCLLLAGAATGHARVDMTVANLIERHGPARSTRDVTENVRGRETFLGREHYFLAGEWTIIAFVRTNICYRITYRKNGTWHEDDFDRWLRENSDPGSPWNEKKSKHPDRQREWTCRLSGGSTRVAVWRPVAGLTIAAADFESSLDYLRDPARWRRRRSGSKRAP